jgi:aminoglycoside/choline kinase family phosphotransferase
VPGVRLADLQAGFVALEDLGDRTFDQAVRDQPAAARRGLYRQAVGLIAELQRIGRTRPDPECLAFGRRFDEPLLRWELEHFREWLLEKDRGAVLDAADSAVLDQAFDWAAATLAGSPPVLVHRDFQSRNLMLVPTVAGEEELRVIDFQDALLGPAVYDLVALLRDSYVELAPGEVDDLLADYAQRAGPISLGNLRKLFHLQTVQRKLKDAGRFVYLDRARGNAGFRRWIPASLRAVRQALPEVPELAAAARLLERHLPELG